MLSVVLILLGIGVIALSGFPALFFGNRSARGQRLTVFLFIAGSLCGFSGTVWSLLLPFPPSLSIPWSLPWGKFYVSVDKLSGFFLLLVFFVPSIASIYSLGYWKQSEHPDNGQRLGLYFGLLSAAAAMVVIARDSVLFLIVWEFMALAVYFAATAESDKPEVRRAGWIYLVATHIGTLVLISMFALWYRATGSFSLDLVLSSVVPASSAGFIFVFAIFGFGFKAGLIPFHVWLPGAHANAPSHVSAVMSGVIIKTGIYGILRMASLFAVCEPWWGILLLVLGSFTAIFGIAFALGQRDLKKILAYSSIENIGIIAMGSGLALLGKALNLPSLALLGLGGALFHVWNHGLFKSMLFLGSGAIIHATDTRDIEKLGGLAKKMPITAVLFAVGALAICALPPLNGFAGEWLIYLGIFNTLSAPSIADLPFAAIAAVALALVGALAVAVFVRLYNTVFSGAVRSSNGLGAHEPGLIMILPMASLAFLCLVFGVFPSLVSPFLEGAVHDWIPLTSFHDSIPELVPQRWISYMNAGILALGGIVTLLILTLTKKKVEPDNRQTWDCGYAQPSARMQYTGAGFGQSLIRFFSFALIPSADKIKVEKIFPDPLKFETSVPDVVLDRGVLPLFAKLNAVLPKVYVFQQGQTWLYVLYVVLITAILFLLGVTGVVL